MHFKLIVVAVEDGHTQEVVDAARAEGATGATVLHQARGEGLVRPKTFFGMDLASQRDVVLLLVEQHLSRRILERIAGVEGFDRRPVSYTHLRAHETVLDLVCRLLLEKKKRMKTDN
mgnify:CR=1 FL=1